MYEPILTPPSYPTTREVETNFIHGVQQFDTSMLASPHRIINECSLIISTMIVLLYIHAYYFIILLMI